MLNEAIKIDNLITNPRNILANAKKTTSPTAIALFEPIFGANNATVNI